MSGACCPRTSSCTAGCRSPAARRRCSTCPPCSRRMSSSRSATRCSGAGISTTTRSARGSRRADGVRGIVVARQRGAAPDPARGLPAREPVPVLADGERPPGPSTAGTGARPMGPRGRPRGSRLRGVEGRARVRGPPARRDRSSSAATSNGTRSWPQTDGCSCDSAPLICTVAPRSSSGSRARCGAEVPAGDSRLLTCCRRHDATRRRGRQQLNSRPGSEPAASAGAGSPSGRPGPAGPCPASRWRP